MKKLAYVSPESFIDVDLPVIKEINKWYDLIWIVTFVREIEGTTRFFSPEYISDYCKINHIHYIIVEEERRSRNPFRIVSALQHIIKPLKRFKPDITYFESFYDPYLPFVARVCLGSAKTIIGLHDAEQHSGTGLIHKLIQKLTIKTFKYFHVFSYTQKDIFIQKHPKKKVQVARLFLKNYGDPKDVEKDPLKTTFLFFGRNYKYKGLDILLQAVNNVPYDLSNKYKVIIAGKCDNFESYSSLIRNKGVYDFRLRFINNNEVSDIFTEADYIVLPYRDVTQSGPLFIAFNYNLPSVTSDLPGFMEYIKNGYNGFTYRTNDIDDLAKCLISIIQMDSESKVKIKNNLGKYIEKEFNLVRTIDEYHHVFGQIS